MSWKRDRIEERIEYNCDPAALHPADRWRYRQEAIRALRCFLKSDIERYRILAADRLERLGIPADLSTWAGCEAALALLTAPPPPEIEPRIS